jgi:hypothetical protein
VHPITLSKPEAITKRLHALCAHLESDGRWLVN